MYACLCWLQEKCIFLCLSPLILCFDTLVTCIIKVFCLFLQKILYLFILRERGREGESEGKKHQCERETLTGYQLPLLSILTGDQTGNMGMCPDQGSNWQPFALQNDAQPTKPHWLRLKVFCLLSYLEVGRSQTQYLSRRCISGFLNYLLKPHSLDLSLDREALYSSSPWGEESKYHSIPTIIHFTKILTLCPIQCHNPISIATMTTKGRDVFFLAKYCLLQHLKMYCKVSRTLL